MPDYPKIAKALETYFNAEDGLDEEVSIELYRRGWASSPSRAALEDEVLRVFSDSQVSWRKMLFNENYEVFEALTEDEAREYARRILWVPIFEC